MPQRLRCVFKCDQFDVLHRFPKPVHPSLETFQQWKEIAGELLLDKDDNYIYTNYRICNRHFEDRFFYPRSKRLAKTAYPTINIEPTASVQASNRPHNQAEGFMEIHPMQNNPVNSSESLVSQQIISQIRAGKTIRRNHNMKMFKKIVALRNKLLDLKNEVKAAKKMSNIKLFHKVLKSLPIPSQTFINMQLTKHRKKSRGRRFTIDEKLMALSIFKKSPKAYNFLRKLFTLPSKRTLQDILKLITLTPGLNPMIFQQIKEASEKLVTEQRLCQLMFDEMSLSPSLHYNAASDQITGFEDFGDGEKTDNIADHVLVFMLKGVKARYKQPICFAFCKSSTKAVTLKKMLKNIIKELLLTGLVVVATVCDQSTTNTKVVNELVSETKADLLRLGQEPRDNAILIENRKVFPLYDPPHLLKGIRNNLLTKELRYTQDGKAKTAKWEHLKLLLEIDEGEDELRMCNKLTEAHVLPEKIPKMKVKHAAQVFSQRVSGALRFCARKKIIPSECEDTADLLLLFDHIFDSFNEGSYKKSYKVYKNCLKRNSEHFTLWRKALPILRSMRFKKETKKRDGTISIHYEQVPSIKNWVHNIINFKDLWQYLSNNHNVDSIIMRNFNQDPVENFFSSVRSHGARNINPSCQQFESIYKTLLVNNLNSSHSLGANCEEDTNKMLHNLDCLLAKNEVPPASRNEQINDNYNIENLAGGSSEEPETNIITETKKYVAGFVIKKLKTKVCKSCNTCNNEMCDTTPPQADEFIHSLDVTRKSLQRPSQNFLTLVRNIIKIIKNVLRNNPHKGRLSQTIKTLINNSSVDFQFLTCNSHKSLKILYRKFDYKINTS